MDPIEKITFDIGKGLYDFKKIQEYEILTIFSGAENQVTSTLTNTATEGQQGSMPIS